MNEVTFYIKNFSLYPNVDFTEEFVVNQNISFVGDKIVSVTETSNKWRSVNDAMAANRKIQTVLGSVYKLEMVLARNINLSLLASADSVLVETSNNDMFNIFNIDTVFEDIQGTALQKIVMTFYRVIENNVIHHLSSDNAEAHMIAGSQNVNELNFTVKKPPITQRANIYLKNMPVIGDTSAFDFKINELTQNINIGDWFYLHVFNDDFDIAYGSANCVEKTANVVTFVFVDAPVFTLPESEITIDFEPENEINVEVDNNNFQINISLFTFLYSKLDNDINFIEENKQRNGFIQDGNVTTIDIDIAKFWVPDSELWKIKYLAYANPTDIVFKQKNRDDIIPIYIKGMINKITKDTLVELHEFEIKLPHKLQNVNLLR